MRALAHPVRLAILRRLREEGVSTASKLAPHVGASPSVTSWHLRHLAEHGLVEDAPNGSGSGRQRWWQVVGRGFRFDVGAADAEAGAALFDALERDEGDLVTAWVEETRPRLEPEWLSASSRWNTVVWVSPAELEALEEAHEAVLVPLVARRIEERPRDSRPVRILRYVLPSAAPELS
ncbi:helix-turn-helix transcriptional regulator [Frondihabitans sp. PAMC 28766]|uniref:ArsR/SmtB family transcription factor n=1 Tax=Frondihabitans sp. PAMC 28766 TaxID=1795630 RepID=UPI001EF534B1|nr:helix-turn-helix domain-containing protein [Frondihabitans sp. PAMC 28766]